MFGLKSAKNKGLESERYEPAVMAALRGSPLPKDEADVLPLSWPPLDGKVRSCGNCGGKTLNMNYLCVRCMQEYFKKYPNTPCIKREAYFRLFYDEIDHWYAAHPLIPSGRYVIEIGEPEKTETDPHRAVRQFRIVEGQFAGLMGSFNEKHPGREDWYRPIRAVINDRLRPYGLADD